MEYVTKSGMKVIVEGDKAQYGSNDIMMTQRIGANFTNGVYLGGYLSSFNDSFGQELISIETGIGDIVNAKIGNIKDAYAMLKSKINGADITDIFELSRIVLETVDEFFGGYANIDDRMNYYYSEDFEQCKDNKISNLRGTGAAMCVERSALSQNLLKALGINSFYKSSGIVKNGNKETHSYNLIEFNDKYYIFDSSMPSLINDQINPLIAEIDKETFTSLSAPIPDIGISTTVSHYNPYRDTDVTITYDSGRKEQIEVNSLGETSKKHV